MSNLTECSRPNAGIGTQGKILKMDGRIDHGTDRIRILRTANQDRVHRPKSRPHSAVLSRGSYIRPASAPTPWGQRIRALSRTSMKEQIFFEERKQAEMHKLVELVRENKQFEKELVDKRDIPTEKPVKDSENDSDVPPMFNKRLFASQGGTVILTAEARRIMEKTKESEFSNEERKLTKSELLTMRFVTEGLRLIHKGHDYVKDVLSHAVTYENLDAFSYVKKKPWEDILSCYYIVNGAVEVTYDMNATAGSRSVYQPNIIYNHGTGEYLGLVSFEGPYEDLTPPATIYTKEFTQFLRIDRQRFHRLLQVASSLIDSRKRNYLSRGRGLLASVAADVKEKILHSLSIQDFPPNRVLINLGETTENIYIIMSGRCHCYRDVYIPEADRTVTFYLCSKEQDQFFGEECVLSNEPSYCTVVSATAITCLKLNRSALQIVSKDRLAKLIENQRNQYPEDEELRTRGYTNSIWNQYKHSKIKQSLNEGGKLNYMHHLEHYVVRERPPKDEDQYREDMFEFLLKSYDMNSGSRRSQSARPRSTKRSIVPDRPKTAIPAHSREQRKTPLGRQLSQLKPDTTITEEDSRDSTETAARSNVVSVETDTRLEGHPEKNRKIASRKSAMKLMNSKENVLKVADDNNEMMKHLKMSTSCGEFKQQESENFTKSSVLATMRTEDIVRRAKALANRKAETGFEATDKDEPEWSTVLHVENKQAKILIKTNNFRINILKKNLKALDKKREMMRAKKIQTKLESSTPIQGSSPDVTESLCLVVPDQKVPAELDRNENQTEVDKTDHPKEQNSILFSVNTYLTEGTALKWFGYSVGILNNITTDQPTDEKRKYRDQTHIDPPLQKFIPDQTQFDPTLQKSIPDQTQFDPTLQKSIPDQTLIDPPLQKSIPDQTQFDPTLQKSIPDQIQFDPTLQKSIPDQTQIDPPLQNYVPDQTQTDPLLQTSIPDEIQIDPPLQKSIPDQTQIDPPLQKSILTITYGPEVV